METQDSSRNAVENHSQLIAKKRVLSISSGHTTEVENGAV